MHGAQRRGLSLSFPEDVEEGPGQGAEGVGRAAGSRGEPRLAARAPITSRTAVARLDAENGAGSGTVLVGVDGRLAAAVILADHLRPDARAGRRPARGRDPPGRHGNR